MPSSIPPEIDGLGTFLKERGTTLLIKGYAGAGKTTLSLQLLRALAPRGNGAYISSRVSELKLSRQLPGLADAMKGPKAYKFRDVRLGTGTLVLEELLNVVGNDGGVPAVVLDTWDGLAKEMEDKERLKAEKTLISIADSTETRMIFVSEEPGRTTMDYLVDGIVELTRSEQYERVFREVEVQKLRGTLIAQHKFLYTLLDGRFLEMPGYRPPRPKPARRKPPIGDRQTGNGTSVSFGSEEMDEAFGGIPKSAVFTLEYTEQVPHTAIRSIELGAVANQVNLGRSALIAPLPGVSEADMESILRPALGEGAWGKRVSVMQIAPGLLRAALSGEEAAQGENVKASTQAMRRQTEQIRSNSADGSILYSSALSMAETASAGNVGRLLEVLSQFVMTISRKGSKDSLLVLLQSDSPIRSRVLALSERHARLFVKDRSVVLLGEKPSTEAYILEHANGDPLTPQITRMV